MYSQLPGTLNLTVKSGDTAGTVVDFSVDLSGYTVSSQIYSLVTGDKVADITTTFVNASAGQVNAALPAQSPPAGSYGWSMHWVAPGGPERTVLSGVCEIIP